MWSFARRSGASRRRCSKAWPAPPIPTRRLPASCVTSRPASRSRSSFDTCATSRWPSRCSRGCWARRRSSGTSWFGTPSTSTGCCRSSTSRRRRCPARPSTVSALLTTLDGLPASLNALRRLKRRELLRIAARDLFECDPPQVVVRQLADLADALIRHAVDLITREACESAGISLLPGKFAVVALGRLGQREMDYGPEVDVVYLFEPVGADSASETEIFEELAWRLTAALGDQTAESDLYRVNVVTSSERAGPALAFDVTGGWDNTAILSAAADRLSLSTARAVAGDVEMGTRIAAVLRGASGDAPADRADAREMLAREVDVLQRERFAPPQALGQACLTTLERFTRALLLAHGLDGGPRVADPGTATGLSALRDAGALDEFDLFTPDGRARFSSPADLPPSVGSGSRRRRAARARSRAVREAARVRGRVDARRRAAAVPRRAVRPLPDAYGRGMTAPSGAGERGEAVFRRSSK